MNLNKRSLYILLGSFIFLMVTAGTGSAENPKTVIEQSFPGYTLLDYRKGNFTNSGKEEYLVFLESKDKDPQVTVTLINEAYVVVINKNKIERRYEIKDLQGIAKYSRFLPLITDRKVNWGEWDGYCCMRDFNENGLDEILFFEITGMSFLPYIFEYKNSEIDLILDPPSTYSNQIMRFEAVDNGSEKYIMIWGWGDEKNADAPNGKRDWYKYAWNKANGKYVIVDKGVQ